MFRFLRHLFIPHERNNHRAKIIHNSSLATILSLFLILNFAWYSISLIRPDILGVSYSISESELLNLVNKERIDHGLAPLTLNPHLSDAARRKAADMLEKNYWAHFAPDGFTSPWGFIRAAGYNYVHAGENLARGFTDSQSTVNAWMNSQTHRDNLLADKYKDVGFAIVPGTLTGEETVLIVEMFGSTTSQTIASLPQAAIQEASTPSSRVAAVAQEDLNKQEVPLVEAKVETIPKIDSRTTSKAVSTVGLTFLAFAFIMDLAIVERRKIPRIVGHNLDHIMLIIGFLLFIVLQKGGHIL
ncbi:MAG: hypothetical protein HY427_03035 [Candidatus Levybacteria bacterium]|nr:hypothetical protein [Candidatus Levybacteria bacterium]